MHLENTCTRMTQKYDHKHKLTQIHTDTCMYNAVRAICTHVKGHNTHAYTCSFWPGWRSTKALTVRTRCHSELHARGSRSDQSVSGIYCPCPAPPPSPPDPPLFSNHPCSGMSHPCSVPKETPPAIDQPHTDSVQCSFHWNSADLDKAGPYVFGHKQYTQTHIHTKQHNHLWH